MIDKNKDEETKRIGIREFLAAFLLIITFWAAKELLDIDLTTVFPGLGPEPEESIQVYFTTPHYPDDKSLHHNGLDERLSAAIDQAERSVDVAAFDFNLESVADALVRAHRRGVRVRLVTDDEYATELGPVRLHRDKIPVVTDDREPFMHDKFIIIDNREVWTGSWNLTDNGTYRNNNNVVVIDSPELAKNYTAEFEEMFKKREFGPTSPDSIPYPVVEFSDCQIETIFESEGNAPERIAELIGQAHESISFMAFVFTDDDLADALITREQAGIPVMGVMEARNVDIHGSDYPALRRAGVDVLPDGNPYILHHKVIIIDNAIVITGSYNFTISAATSNDENVLIIHSSEIASRYLEEFDKMYQQAENAASGD